MPDSFDFKVEFDKIMMLVQLAGNCEIDLDAIEHTIEAADSVGPILDPTAYMRGMRNLDQQREVLRFAAPFIRGSQALLKAAKASA